VMAAVFGRACKKRGGRGYRGEGQYPRPTGLFPTEKSQLQSKDFAWEEEGGGAQTSHRGA